MAEAELELDKAGIDPGVEMSEDRETSSGVAREDEAVVEGRE